MLLYNSIRGVGSLSQGFQAKRSGIRQVGFVPPPPSPSIGVGISFMFIPLLPFHWSMALEVGDKPLHVCDDFRSKPRCQAGLQIMESLALAIHH